MAELGVPYLLGQRPPFGEDVEALLGALPRSCGVVFASATGAALLGDEGEAARRARAALRVDATAAGRAGVASGALAAKARHGRLRAKAPLDALRRVLRAAAPACEAALVGQIWNEDAARRAGEAARQDFRPIDDHRATANYRLRVAGNLFVRLHRDLEGADKIEVTTL